MTSSYLDFPDIDPVLVSIGPLFGYGPLNIHWYGVMYAVAFGLAYWLASRAAAKSGSGWTKEQVSDLLFFGKRKPSCSVTSTIRNFLILKRLKEKPPSKS